MIELSIYPGGKTAAVTFSYDDGHENDKRLAELFNKYKVKATFHLNGINYIGKSDDELKEIGNIYKGHEISCHTLSHGWPAHTPPASLVREVTEDRKILEKIAGYPVVGMSYPSGSFSHTVEEVIRSCGILYSRTTLSTMRFRPPENFLEWNPACHHRDALALSEKFLAEIDSPWIEHLFYIWGHSHELRTEDDWAYIEKVISTLSGNNKVWYATNIEIYRYIKAQQQLEISSDENIFYNPTSIDVWVVKNKEQIIKIPAGEQITL